MPCASSQGFTAAGVQNSPATGLLATGRRSTAFVSAILGTRLASRTRISIAAAPPWRATRYSAPQSVQTSAASVVPEASASPVPVTTSLPVYSSSRAQGLWRLGLRAPRLFHVYSLAHSLPLALLDSSLGHSRRGRDPRIEIPISNPTPQSQRT
ncbi:hypothetical protein B0H19DRAFT_1071494 [Mycena capillaripes]|nr:hypothetical protein B0H19DRAFT_1071494 [Mycena capillaripes]